MGDLENSIVGMASVASACVVAVSHPKFDERPVAIVVLAPGVKSVTRDEVHAHLQKDGRFTKWQWPDDVLAWEAIPMTGTGKIDKKNRPCHAEGQGLRGPETLGKQA